MLTIIGCGNLNRSDDGVGVVVAQRLAHRLARHPVPGVQVFDCGTAGIEVMFKARGSSALLVIDACESGSEPGTLFEAPGEELASKREPSHSLHDFRWDHALHAGKKIFGEAFPSDVTVLLVEAATTTYGLELSETVAATAERAYQRALALVAEHVAQRHSGREATLRLDRGSLRMSAADYGAYFEGREGALLLDLEGVPHLVPVDQVAGGYLVKQRNLAGDRAIQVADALERWGVGPDVRRDIRARWSEAAGGLALDLEG